MYNYVFDNNEKKVVMKCEESTICEAYVRIDEDVAILRYVDIKKLNGESHTDIVAKMCSATKEILLDNGIVVEKVRCGDISDVFKYDQYLKSLDTELTNEKNVVRTSKR